MSEYLHIVCLDAPGPPDYGGAIDMFYKIKALSQIGKKIILHYFNYNPARNAAGLEQFCETMISYNRKPFFKSLPLSQPYIVQSRINKDLIHRLNQDNHPILLEGLHCSGIIPFLHHPERIIIRIHNEEAAYYHHLSLAEPSFLKRKYYIQESRLLKNYQTKLDKQIKLACLSQSDMETLSNDYNFQSASFVPCFIPWQKLTIKEGRGEYCLYHGNMAVSENEEAVLWLLQNVFSYLNVPFYIAGKGISKRLQGFAESLKNVTLISDPSIAQIDALIQNAHINVLPSMNNTGVKLKLLNALLNGRHCITNFNGVKGSQINSWLFIKNEPAEWIEMINKLMPQDFAPHEMEARNAVLSLYNNRQNAGLINALWKHYQ